MILYFLCQTFKPLDFFATQKKPGNQVIRFPRSQKKSIFRTFFHQGDKFYPNYIITAVQTWKGFNTLWFCGLIQTLRFNLIIAGNKCYKIGHSFWAVGTKWTKGSNLVLQVVSRQMTSTCKEKLTRTTVRCWSDILWKKRATFIPSSTTQTKRKMRKKGIMAFPLTRVSYASPFWTLQLDL